MNILKYIFFVALFGYSFRVIAIDFADYQMCWDEDFHAGEEAIREASNSLVSVNTSEAQYVRALCLAKLSEFKLVVDVVGGVISRYPSYPMAHQLRGIAFLKIGKTSSAIDDLKFSIENNLGDRKDYLFLSKAYVQEQDYSKAKEVILIGINNFRTSLAGGKNSVIVRYVEVEMYIQLVEILRLEGRVKEIQGVLATSLVHNPNSLELFEMLASYLYEQSDMVAISKLLDTYCSNANIRESKYCP